MNYLIRTCFDVYEDDYNEGEGKYVNSWDYQSKHDADEIQSAMQQHFEQHGLSYDANYLFHEDDIRSYSWTVDEECFEATEKQIEQWKQGRKKLYSMHASIKIYKLEQI
jgi:hypothetical protein